MLRQGRTYINNEIVLSCTVQFDSNPQRLFYLTGDAVVLAILRQYDHLIIVTSERIMDCGYDFIVYCACMYDKYATNVNRYGTNVANEKVIKRVGHLDNWYRSDTCTVCQIRDHCYVISKSRCTIHVTPRCNVTHFKVLYAKAKLHLITAAQIFGKHDIAALVLLLMLELYRCDADLPVLAI